MPSVFRQRHTLVCCCTWAVLWRSACELLPRVRCYNSKANMRGNISIPSYIIMIENADISFGIVLKIIKWYFHGRLPIIHTVSTCQPRQWIMSAIKLTGRQGCDEESRSLYEPLSLQNLLMSVLLDGLQIRYQLLQCSLSCHPKTIERETLIKLPCEGCLI